MGSGLVFYGKSSKLSVTTFIFFFLIQQLTHLVEAFCHINSLSFVKVVLKMSSLILPTNMSFINSISLPLLMSYFLRRCQETFCTSICPAVNLIAISRDPGPWFGTVSIVQPINTALSVRSPFFYTLHFTACSTEH